MPALATEMAGQRSNAPGPDIRRLVPMPEQAYKRCKDCGETKPLTEFHRNWRMKGGRVNDCKPCRNAKKTTDERRRDKRRHRSRYPEKAKARKAVENAVYKGTLAKPNTCEGCGLVAPEPSEIHAHHRDYSKPLEVEWLCADCHRSRHGEGER